MIDPGGALLLFAALTLGVVALLWPRTGILARLRRLTRMTQRVRNEDAVKYLFHAGGEGAVVRPEALAGALELGPAQARELLATLVANGLVRPDGPGFRLTEPGRRDALRVVRAHRLLERYLADHTGVEPAEWHEWAEDAEHELSPAEAEALAARLGDPRFDPHGDPIPTAQGELPRAPVILLGQLETDAPGTIVHVEDEPRDAYEALERAGVALGATLVVRERRMNDVRLDVNGHTVTLPRLLESAVGVRRVVALPLGQRFTLADVAPGQQGRVAGLSLRCSGAQRRRLLDLGVVPGTVITAVLRSAGGDPVAYDIRGALIALRRQQAQWIELDGEPQHAERRA
jgi:DtxR family transcriptional regulator, Mn-dependent transcriptional regulator